MEKPLSSKDLRGFFLLYLLITRRWRDQSLKFALRAARICALTGGHFPRSCFLAAAVPSGAVREQPSPLERSLLVLLQAHACLPLESACAAGQPALRCCAG